MKTSVRTLITALLVSVTSSAWASSSISLGHLDSSSTVNVHTLQDDAYAVVILVKDGDPVLYMDTQTSVWYNSAGIYCYDTGGEEIFFSGFPEGDYTIEFSPPTYGSLTTSSSGQYFSWVGSWGEYVYTWFFVY